MAKSLSDRKKYLSEFETSIMEPLAKKYEGLLKDPKRRDSEECKVLGKYIHQLKSNIAQLQGESLKPQDVQKFFDNCKESTAEATKGLKAQRSWVRFFIDVLKDIANFCIKCLTIGYSPQFLNTTTKPVDSTQREINAIKKDLEQFIERQEPDRGPSQQAAI